MAVESVPWAWRLTAASHEWRPVPPIFLSRFLQVGAVLYV